MFFLFQLSSLFPQDSPPKMFQCCLLTELYFPSGQQCLIHMAQKKNAWFSKVISKLFLLSYATSFVVFLKTFLRRCLSLHISLHIQGLTILLWHLLLSPFDSRVTTFK